MTYFWHSVYLGFELTKLPCSQRGNQGQNKYIFVCYLNTKHEINCNCCKLSVSYQSIQCFKKNKNEKKTVQKLYDLFRNTNRLSHFNLLLWIFFWFLNVALFLTLDSSQDHYCFQRENFNCKITAAVDYINPCNKTV